MCHSCGVSSARVRVRVRVKVRVRVRVRVGGQRADGGERAAAVRGVEQDYGELEARER